MRVKQENYLEARIKLLRNSATEDCNNDNFCNSSRQAAVEQRIQDNSISPLMCRPTPLQPQMNGIIMTTAKALNASKKRQTSMNSFEDVDSSSSEEGGASEEQDRCSDRLSQKKYYRLNDLRKQSRSHERNRANVINDRRRENSCTTSPRKESGDMGGLFMR